MNHTLQEMILYKKIIEESSVSSFFLAPATCYLPLMHSKKYQLCAQNVSLKEDENKTGSVSSIALKSLDVKALLIGHDEIHDSLENKISKIKNALKNHLRVFVILSETKEEHDYQYTFVKLMGLIRAILSQVSSINYSLISFIYEPSWLIGGDISLEASFVSNIFFQIKKTLEQEYHYPFSLLYGGGLNEKNISSFLEDKNIDGLLLGNFCNDAKNVVKLLSL